ncbi:MAG TPA: hypothetical protein EYG97_01740 [Arcobacter sp.]|nr:hypothetical protein [Arcobacter sp.]HIP55724.1 hypothetical protein [Arcobacter sp.]
MDFYEELIENDLNPFILFNSNGKVKNFNKEAEFLFNFVTTKELFDLAISYASSTFGFKREFITLKYEKQSFYAILVGYANDDEIALRLYKEVTIVEAVNIETNFQETNLYTLIDLSKSTTLINSNLKIEEIYDVSIPELKLDINQFLVTLNTIFDQLKDLTTLTLKVFIKTGEYEIINAKKYNIISIEFKSEEKIDFIDTNQFANTNVFFVQNTIKIEIPLIM